MNYKILKDGEEINTIVSDADFVEKYCSANGYTYELMPEPEPEPTPEPEEPENIWDELDKAYREGVDSV